MHEEISISEWEAQPFDAFKLHICETIRQLDEAVGRPPFPNPSTEKSRSLAQRLLCMLQYVHKKNLISSLSKCPEVNMTFPVLCASLTSGSEGECPCPVLMQLFLESLICVHSVSLYPPQTTLKDAKMVLPTSPVSFRLFAVTGAMDVDNMLFFFFGMVEPEPKTKVIENKPTNGGEGRKKISKKNIGKNDTINVSRDMLMVALDVVLPSECTELLLSLFNSPSKFQQIVGSDSELASRALAVFHDSLPKLLSPLSLLRCLDVYILDTFIDVVKVHGDNMTLLITESVFTEIPLAEWSPERFTRLIRYCVQRKVRREEALPSLVVYVFLYKLVVLWGKARTFKLMHIEEELKFWEVLLNTAKMIALRVSARPSTRKGNEEAEEQQQQQAVQALSGVAEYIKQQYTIIDVRNVVACGIPHASVKAVLDVLITLLLNVKGNVMVSPAVTETSGGKKSNSNNNNKKREKHQTNITTGTNKNNKKNNNANKHNNNNNNNNVSLSSSMVMQDDSVDLFCKWISESFAFLFWLMPSSAVELPINNVEGILETLAALLLHLAEKTMGKLPQVSTWESYLNFIISAIVVWEEKAPVLLTGQKFASSLFLAVKATHRVECCGIIAERMPETYTSLRWSLHDYDKILLNAWLQHGERGPCVESFYAPVVALSSTEYIGILLNFLDDHQINELAQLLLKTEQKTVAFISLLNKALQEEPISSTTRIADGEAPEEENEDETVKKKKMRRKGLLRLQNKLLSGVDDRSKMLTEQKQRDEETRKVKLLMEVQRREELVAGAMAFEKELQKHREMKDEEMRLIEEMREERRREKEMRLAKERQERQERRQKAIEMLQEMNAKTKAEREAEQRERLLRYRERVTMDSRISSFLEQLHLPSSRIMRLLATLRPHILDMTHDDVLEFVVTGRRKVPSDMHAVDEGVQNNNNNNNDNNDNNNDDLNTGETSRKREEKKKTACFADEAPSFWDSVMQLVAYKSNEEKRNGDAVNVEGEYYDENPLPEASSSFSFHRRVSVVLDLFDYSMGTNETLPNPLPSLNVRSATRVLDKEALVGTGFCNAREALLACQQRGLCVLRSNTCTLQPLGFRYHYPFHNPKQLIDIQLEERREKVREMMAKQRGAVDVEACEGEDGSMLLDTDDETDDYDDDDDVVRFTDELV